MAQWSNHALTGTPPSTTSWKCAGSGSSKGWAACGVSPPHDEVLLFRQKDPKPLAPGRGPSGACAPVPVTWAAELATLRQSSPPNRNCGTGAQPRPQAPGNASRRFALLSVMPGSSGIQRLWFFLLLSFSTLVIENPASLLFLLVVKRKILDSRKDEPKAERSPLSKAKRSSFQSLDASRQ